LKIVRKVSAVAKVSKPVHGSSRAGSQAGSGKKAKKAMNGTFTAEVAVIGGGPAGLVAALALAAAGVETLLIAPQAVPDNRTTALLAGSVTALETLGVWQACRPHAAPLEKIRLVDDTRRLFRAPEVAFAAAEIGLDAFGYNVENRHLIAALESRAAAVSLRRMPTPALAVTNDAGAVTIKHAGGEARVQLAIGADGARSLCRAAASISTQRRTYPQAALTLNLAHQRPHQNISTEFHTETGPFTLVPLPGFRSSLVCVLEPALALQLKDEEEILLSADIERRSHSLLGKITVESSRGVIPLTIETADAFGRGRIVLIGEAAHVVPPIGAQGLNLGLRDAAAIAEIVADAWRQKRDIGALGVVERYDTERRADVATRSIAVDFLNRSLLTDFLPAHGARGISLYLVDRIGLLRRALLREGVAPAASQPRLMRGEMA
jgi:2-octaprenyl-6-methoxyphenol hydroxylase